MRQTGVILLRIWLEFNVCKIKSSHRTLFLRVKPLLLKYENHNAINKLKVGNIKYVNIFLLLQASHDEKNIHLKSIYFSLKIT